MGIDAQLTKVVGPFCTESVVPPSAGCCGFAGDRGFLVPELTASATRREAEDSNPSGAVARISISSSPVAGAYESGLSSTSIAFASSSRPFRAKRRRARRGSRPSVGTSSNWLTSMAMGI